MTWLHLSHLSAEIATLEQGTQKTKVLVPLCAGYVTLAKSSHLWKGGAGFFLHKRT